MSLPVEPPNDTLLGKYQVLKRIGMGGMAEVFHGRHEKLNRDVAIKILHSSLAEDPQFIARLSGKPGWLHPAASRHCAGL